MSESAEKNIELTTSNIIAEKIDTSDKLEKIDTIKYLCNIIAVVTKSSYTIMHFVKKWYNEHLDKEYKTPEEAFYEFFCDRTNSAYAIYIPDLPILASHHENNFKKESVEELPVNWECENCTDCKWCINCKDCKNCRNSIECISCTDCINCKKCTYVDFAYNCRHVYHSCFVIDKTNRTNLEGSCDDHCNWNCINCTDCYCCIDCEDCVGCYYSEGCFQCTELNTVYKEYIHAIVSTNDNKITKTRRMFKIYILLNRLGMISNDCTECSRCDYIHDGITETNIVGDNDPNNIEFINDYMSNLCKQSKK